MSDWDSLASPNPPAPSGGTPSSGDVRRAADALKDAIDRHLFAVETRMGEADPLVQRAFRDISDAAEQYDDLMYQLYDEVTPFEFSEGGEDPDGEGGTGYDEAAEPPPVISVLVRRDYAVFDPNLLLDTGRQAYRALNEAGAPQYEDHEPRNLPGALYAMFQLAGVDGFDNGSEEAGIEPLGGAVWFLAGGDPDLVDIDTPFTNIDEDSLIFRIQEIPEIEPE